SRWKFRTAVCVCRPPAHPARVVRDDRGRDQGREHSGRSSTACEWLHGTRRAANRPPTHRPCGDFHRRPLTPTLLVRRQPTMRNIFALVLAVFTAGLVSAAGPELKTDQDKTLYALGLAVSQQLQNFALTESELALVKAGIEDGVLKHPSKVEL